MKIQEGESNKFSRVRSCCSKKECAKKITIRDQMTAHKLFHELESNPKRDSYLMNCIEHVRKAKSGQSKNFREKKVEDDRGETRGRVEEEVAVTRRIQMEIESESNGNQKLSDEIQNAINESLKDCIVAGVKKDSGIREELSPAGDKEEKNNWNYYIVIDRCRKKVCLQFLLKLFRITKNRIKQLQKRILSGAPSAEESNVSKASQRSQEIWEMAKCHLDSLPGEESSNCVAIPRHRFLSQEWSREELFDRFKEFYHHRNGKELLLKFPAYKRFLGRETSVSFAPYEEGTCAECDDSKARKKWSKNHKESGRLQKSKPGGESKGKKKKSDSTNSNSDEESPLKCKKLKLTIPLKGINNSSKSPQSPGKKSFKSRHPDKRSKEKPHKDKSRQLASSKGRDVWSLMLLHLETMPYKESIRCTSKKRHRFLDTTFTTQGLFDDYRKYFLKETNSELGLGFSMYEKYFNRNCNYAIMDLNAEETECPSCATDRTRS